MSSDDDSVTGCFAVICILVILLFAFCVTFVGCGITYSEGFRDGYLQKFSHKGLMVQSWEGELSLSWFHTRNDRVSNVFDFSVDDPNIIAELQNISPNVPIRIYYRQVFINAILRHSTPYRAIRIEVIKKKEQNE